MESANKGQEVALWFIDWDYHKFWGLVCLPAGTSVEILPTWYREWQKLPEDDRPEYTDWIVGEKGCVERKGVGFCAFGSEGFDGEEGEEETVPVCVGPAASGPCTEAMAAFNLRVENTVQGRRKRGGKCLSIDLEDMTNDECRVVEGVFRRVAAMAGLDYDAARDHLWVIRCWLKAAPTVAAGVASAVVVQNSPCGRV